MLENCKSRSRVHSDVLVFDINDILVDIKCTGQVISIIFRKIFTPFGRFQVERTEVRCLVILSKLPKAFISKTLNISNDNWSISVLELEQIYCNNVTITADIKFKKIKFKTIKK